MSVARTRPRFESCQQAAVRLWLAGALTVGAAVGLVAQAPPAWREVGSLVVNVAPSKKDGRPWDVDPGLGFMPGVFFGRLAGPFAAIMSFPQGLTSTAPDLVICIADGRDAVCHERRFGRGSKPGSLWPNRGSVSLPATPLPDGAFGVVVVDMDLLVPPAEFVLGVVVVPDDAQPSLREIWDIEAALRRIALSHGAGYVPSQFPRKSMRELGEACAHEAAMADPGCQLPGASAGTVAFVSVGRDAPSCGDALRFHILARADGAAEWVRRPELPAGLAQLQIQIVGPACPGTTTFDWEIDGTSLVSSEPAIRYHFTRGSHYVSAGIRCAGELVSCTAGRRRVRLTVN